MGVRARVTAALILSLAVTGLAVGGQVPAALAGPAAGPADANQIRDEAAWIRAAQRPDGAIEPVPDFGRILPYLGNYAALGLARAAGQLHDPAYADAAWSWLAWYQAHQDASGFVTDYLVTDGIETSTQTYDSTDAYAGTFLTATAATWQANPDRDRLKSLAHGIAQAVAAIEATQTGDGLTWASPGYQVKLMMDNTEVYGGLRSAVTLATALGEPALASRATRDARRLAAGIAAWWNPRAGGFDWAKTSNGSRSAPTWTVLYPDAMENAWVIAYGLATRAQAASILSHLGRMQPGWADPDQSAPMQEAGAVSAQPVGYWPQAGWALVLAGRPGPALAAAATISAGTAARSWSWPFTTADAGALIALRSGWPATAPWAVPLSAGRHSPRPGSGAAGVLAVVAVVAAVVVLTAAAAGWVLTRRGRRSGRMAAFLARIAGRRRRPRL